jgi:hypothetical protein
VTLDSVRLTLHPTVGFRLLIWQSKLRVSIEKTALENHAFGWAAEWEVASVLLEQIIATSRYAW